MTIDDSIAVVNKFRGESLTETIAQIEAGLRGRSVSQIKATNERQGVNQHLIQSAVDVKRASAQIDVVMHAAGILYSLPLLLDPDEIVESLSLGAGNAGSDFDLVTNRRIAEFKFVYWQGGAESVRKKTLFQDFFRLARFETTKSKFLYLLNIDIPLRFLSGGSQITRILDRNRRLLEDFQARYGSQYQTVGQFYRAYQGDIHLVDLGALVPALRVLSQVLTEEDV